MSGPLVLSEWTTDALYAALHATFPQKDSYGTVRRVLLGEVRNATGAAADRSADAVLCEFWPSDGLHIVGFEMKASRADWLRELKSPEKSAAFTQYCDAWWVVAAPDVVKPDEVPPGWGLYVPNVRGKLHAVVTAQKNRPIELSRGFVLSLVRRAVEDGYLPALRAQRDSLAREAKAQAERELRQMRDRVAECEKLIAEFKNASGIDLSSVKYSGESVRHIGETVRAVRSVLSNGYGGALQTIQGHANVLRRLATECDAATDEIRRLRETDQAAVGASPNPGGVA